jgi:ABC-type Fe3+ transport system substrate-binding protein
MEPVLSNASVVTLVKGATHPHAAMLLIDYLLSKEAQQVLEKADYLPAHPDVKPQQSLQGIVPSMAHLKEQFLSEEYMFEARAKSIELQKKYFQSQ